MRNNIQIVLIILSIFLITACTNSETESEQNNTDPFMNLSNTPKEAGEEEPPLDSPLDGLTEEDKILPEEENKEQSDAEEIEEAQPELDDMQRAIPVDPNTPPEQYLGDEASQVEMIRDLPFDNFKERWNAISDANYSNLYIKEFQETQTDDGITYTASLANNLELQVHVTSDYVQSVGAYTKSSVDAMKMLSAWYQVIQVMHPNIEVHDVDAFFHEIGVGPNGNLTALKMGSIPYYHITYEIAKVDNEYVFLGTYR
ncbi:hypothetical protein [Ornithinibacillus scapharcae]|uniref:hypothetical protein n=1 Tax=Ornithinibacillus scapharcae TaxID=1147159 RepID=UPI000225B9EB|nr:hypothetical protein [Ornithinibacillus scapharcae]